MPTPIPVVCDRCRVEGVAGEAQFADFGDLLDFEPVPRRPRADGWTPELQRAFIAALAVTEKGRHRLAAGVSAAIEADARPDLVGAAPAPSEDPAAEAKATRALLETLVRKYLIKLEEEREARLEGAIVEADFCVRQITWLEVALDLASGDGLKLLRDYRCGDYHLIDIAETPMSQLLDAARRDHWAAAGDPPRPEPPDRRRLVDHGRFSTEPVEATWSGRELSHEEQRARFKEQHVRDARAQVAWEAEARRDHERRREAEPVLSPVEGPGMDEEPGRGRPACDLQVDRTDVTNSVRDGPAPEERPAGEGNGASPPPPHEEPEK